MSDPKPNGDSPQHETLDDVLKAVQDSEPAPRYVEPMPEVDPVVTPEPVPASAAPRPPAAPHVPVPTPPRRSGAVLGGVIGAILALGLGYGALRYGPPGLLPQPDMSGLSEAVATASGEVAELKAQVAALPAPTAVDPALAERIATLETAVTSVPPAPAPDLSGVEQQLAALAERIARLEARPAPSAAPVAAGDVSAEALQAIAALQAEVSALKSAEGTASAALATKASEVEALLREAQAEAQKMAAAASAEAQAALAGAALSRIQAALDSGAPYEGVLADLAPDSVPEALSAHAATGVPTLQSLTEGFPVAARTALEASLEARMGETWTDRALTFLRTETGIRSVDPREGVDPDAVLSRAEAAVQDGRLAEALAELAALPPEGQAAMQGWADQARVRIDAIAALNAIATAIGRG